MKKVLLIVIDSLTGWVVEEAIADGRLPVLADLARRGEIRYDSVAVFPSITPAATAALATGAYSCVHNIAGNYWYDEDAHKVVYYGPDVLAILNQGIGDFFEDFLVRFNRERLRTQTIFERVEAAGQTAASLNFLIFRGARPHAVDVPLLLELLPGVPTREEVEGPTLLALGDLVRIDLDGQPIAAPGGPMHKMGFNDDNTAANLIELAKRDALPAFTLAYFPDYDGACHRKGPADAWPALANVDAHLGALGDVYGGLDARLDEITIVITGDHAQCDIVDGGEEAGIGLDDLLADLSVAQAGTAMTQEDDLVACPNLRTAQIYIHTPTPDRFAHVADLLQQRCATQMRVERSCAMSNLSIQSVSDLQEAVRSHARVLVRAGGSKRALSTPADEETTLLDLSALSGVTAYEPDEFTFTARAGTPVAEVQAMLAEEGQYLPFDPPLAAAGATLGGVVAAGTSGAGRYRYGGVRDFLIGVRFVDGRGEEVRGGGAVVKNAAGFDFPKLMVGSLGRLGILTEVTFKVFPAAPATTTICVTFATPDEAMDALVWLTRSQFDLDAVDLAPEEDGFQLWVRLGGLAGALPDRMERLSALLQERFAPASIDQYPAGNDPGYWRDLSGMSWRAGEHSLVKVPVTPQRIRTLEPLLAEREVARRYSAGGVLAWIAWETDLLHLDHLLKEQSLAGVVLAGPPGRPWLGTLPGAELVRRIAAVLDPQAKLAAPPDR